MQVLLEHPNCGMAHAAGLVFRGAGEVRVAIRSEHCLMAIGTRSERSVK